MEKTVQALKAHLALNVKDVERSIEFYKKLFGIEPSKVRTGYAKFNVDQCTIRSPIDGVVLQKYREVGSTINFGGMIQGSFD